MTPRPTRARLRPLIRAASIAAVALAAQPALASFHFAHIERVMTGLDGTTDVQFVEIVMDGLGQNLISGSKLVAFSAEGTFAHIVLTVPANVTSGRISWLMASDGFAAAAGIDADFPFDSSGNNGLVAENGMLCWGKPSAGSQSNPNGSGYVDCVSYGNYTGPVNVHTSAPSPVTPFGHGLVRVADNDSSAEDFVCEDPATPKNNDSETGQIAASTSCSAAPVCGNDEVEEPEECDDGDTDFATGDFCSADCTIVPCGIPTNPNGTEPKTSDALFVLRTAVGQSSCDVRVCDVNGSNTVTTGDALAILRKAVGQNVEFNCTA